MDVLRRMAVLGGLVAPAVALSGCGCGAQAAASESEPTAAASAPGAATSGAEQPAAPAAPLTVDSLQGSWVEFWALSGRADTQRYTFLPDGRFGWCAGPTDAGAPARRWGRFSIASDALVLSVQGEDARHDCDGTAACRTVHEPAVEQRLALGACPDNEEARALDASYRCVSVGGQAFWLRPDVGAGDSQAAALAK